MILSAIHITLLLYSILHMQFEMLRLSQLWHGVTCKILLWDVNENSNHKFLHPYMYNNYMPVCMLGVDII